MVLALVLLAALVLTAAAFALGQRAGRRAGWAIAAGLAALAGVLVAARTGGGGEPLAVTIPWLPTLGVALNLRLDALGFLFALVVLVVGALVMAYAVYYLPDGRHGSFYALLTFFAAAMLGLVMANDLVVLWVTWEFTTLTSFLLVSQSGPKGQGPAIRTLLVTGAGGLCLLAGVALTVTATGTTVLDAALRSPVWAERPDVAALVATLVAFAAFTKSAQFPFHAWLPDAMVASTPVSAYLHAAAMVKAGIYVLLRFSTAFRELPAWTTTLLLVGLVTALMGAVFALQRHDLKELLAYSTVSQLGFLVATIGLGTEYALVGALVHVVAHALFKSALFMAVGLIDHEAGTRDLRRLQWLARTMPATTAVLAVAAASMAGLPPLFGFVSKEAMFKAMADAPAGPAATLAICAVAVTAAICTFAYSARMLRPAFPGRPTGVEPHEAPAGMIAPVALASGAGLVLGLGGPLAEPAVAAAASAITDAPASPDFSLWHGWTPALAMSLVVMGVGALAVVGRRRIDAALDRTIVPVRAVDVVEGFRSGAIALGGVVGAPTRGDAPYRHLVPPVVALVVLVGAGVSVVGLPPLPTGVGQPLDWLLLAIVALGVALTVRARSRVALVTTVGVVGFCMTLFFIVLGAPDVALTQLLVEILTVVMMVLLLVRLPGAFHATPRGRTASAASLAAVAGLAGFALAWLVIGSDSLSPVGRKLIERAYELTGGTNVVNTILVDFRAFDTFGEMVVLGMAAVALVVALEARGLLPRRRSPVVVPDASPARDPRVNTIALRVTDRVVGLVLLGLSIWFFLRGHYNPGGGFIAALTASAAVALIFLAAPDDGVARLRLPRMRFVGGGIVLAVVVGLGGMAAGSFLRPLYVDVLGLQLSTGLIFDLGVYFTVLGLVLATIGLLGLEGHEPPPMRRPVDVTVRKGGR